MKRKRNKGSHGGGDLAARQLLAIVERVRRDGEVYGKVEIHQKLQQTLGHKVLAHRLATRGISYEVARKDGRHVYRYWNDESLERARKRERESQNEALKRAGATIEDLARPDTIIADDVPDEELSNVTYANLKREDYSRMGPIVARSFDDPGDEDDATEDRARARELLRPSDLADQLPVGNVIEEPERSAWYWQFVESHPATSEEELDRFKVRGDLAAQGEWRWGFVFAVKYTPGEPATWAYLGGGFAGTLERAWAKLRGEMGAVVRSGGAVRHPSLVYAGRADWGPGRYFVDQKKLAELYAGPPAGEDPKVEYLPPGWPFVRKEE